MLTSTALRLASTGGSSPSPVLAGRPRGVLHVCIGRASRTPRPMCGQSTRRLYVVVDGQSSTRLGAHVSGRVLCRRCATALQRAEPCGSLPVTFDGWTRYLRGLTLDDIYLSFLAATTQAEATRCGLAGLVLYGECWFNHRRPPEGLTSWFDQMGVHGDFSPAQLGAAVRSWLRRLPEITTRTDVLDAYAQART